MGHFKVSFKAKGSPMVQPLRHVCQDNKSFNEMFIDEREKCALKGKSRTALTNEGSIF